MPERGKVTRKIAIEEIEKNLIFPNLKDKPIKMEPTNMQVTREIIVSEKLFIFC